MTEIVEQIFFLISHDFFFFSVFFFSILHFFFFCSFTFCNFTCLYYFYIIKYFRKFFIHHVHTISTALFTYYKFPLSCENFRNMLYILLFLIRFPLNLFHLFY